MLDANLTTALTEHLYACSGRVKSSHPPGQQPRRSPQSVGRHEAVGLPGIRLAGSVGMPVCQGGKDRFRRFLRSRPFA